MTEDEIRTLVTEMWLDPHFNAEGMTIMTGEGGFIEFDWTRIALNVAPEDYIELAKKYHELYCETRFKLERKISSYDRLRKLFNSIWKKNKMLEKLIT